MLNTPKILGISMAPQRNRRRLLTVMYAVLLACILPIIVPPWADRIPAAYFLFFPLIACFLIEIRVFPKLLKVSEFANHSGAIIHGMQPGSPEMEELDEREMTVRNAAHFHAFRVIKMFSLVVVLIVGPGGSKLFPFAAFALFLLLIMTFTLPQAIILWTEPDVPEDAGLA